MTAQIRGLAQGGYSVTLEGGGKKDRGIAGKEGGMEVGEERREDRGKVQGQGTGRTRGKRRLRREVTVGGGKGEAVGQGKGEAKEALTRECPQALQPAADNFCIVSSKA